MFQIRPVPMFASLVLCAALITGCDTSGGTGGPPTHHPPLAAFTADGSIQAGTPLGFDASSSSDPDGTPLTYSWDFGDGGRGGGPKLAHVFTTPGSRTVTLTVRDAAGAQASVSQGVEVISAKAPGPVVAIQGTVRSMDGVALAGVSVEQVGGPVTGTTDSAGLVSLSLPGGVDQTLRLTKAGYAEDLQVLKLADQPGVTFAATLLRRGPPQTMEAGAGGNVQGTDGVALTLPPAALVNAAGQPVSGAVTVSLTPVDISTPAGTDAFPGRFEGLSPAGTSGPIVSYGTAEYSITQDGERLQLAPGRTATIDIPVYADMALGGAALKAGDTVPLWSLDERTGSWVQEGQGTLVTRSGGLALHAEVGHFSWWNADIGFDPYGPQPRCIPDPLVPGGGDHFVNATICNMLADMDRGLGSAALGAAAAPPRLPAFQANASVPITGGIRLPVPANQPVILRGCLSENGVPWCGQRVVSGAVGVTEEVLIKLRPLTQAQLAVSIVSPAGPVLTNGVRPLPVQVAVNTGGLLPDKLELLLDGTVVATLDRSDRADVTLYSVSEGTHQLTARLSLGGQTLTSAPISVTIERVAPTVVSRTPAPGGFGGAATPIRAVFSEAVLPASLTEASVVLRAGGAVVGRTVTLSDDGRTLSITPSPPLSVPSAPEVTLTSGITDLAGNGLVLDGTPWAWTLSVWTPIGGPAEGSDFHPGGTPAPRMVLGTDGQPIVAFAATAKSSRTQLDDLVVRRWNGSAWVNLGGPFSAVTVGSGLDATSVACVSLALDPAGHPVVVWDEATGNSAEGFPTGYAYYARRYNPGTAHWDELGPNGGQIDTRSSLYGPCSGLPTSLAVDRAGRPVVAYYTENGLFVKRFDNGAWTGIGPAGGRLGTPSYAGFALALTSGNDPVVAWGDQNAGTTRVSRYVSATDSWSTVGPENGSVRAGGLIVSVPQLLLDASDQPLLSGTVRVPYGANVTTGGVTVFRYSGATWQEVGPRAAGYGVAEGQLATVALDGSGHPVLAYVGSTSDGYNLYVRRYNGAAWEGVGTASGQVGAAAIGPLSLARDTAGTFTLAFQGIPQSVQVTRFP